MTIMSLWLSHDYRLYIFTYNLCYETDFSYLILTNGD